MIESRNKTTILVHLVNLENTTTNALNSRTILLWGLMATLCGNVAFSQSHNIKNDTFWDTRNGEPIYSQGGAIFKFTDPNTNQEKY